MVFLSGASEAAGRSWAGVGFMVAPWAAPSIVSFKATSERIASLRVKVLGGVLNIFTAYAPHDGHDFDSRHTSPCTLSENMKSRGSHEEIIVLGDFNAQLGHVGAGEEEKVGATFFTKYCGSGLL